MRDIRFIAEHRGGLLNKDHHRLLIIWACLCAEHVLPLFSETIDERLTKALLIAKEWANGNTNVGDAMKSSVDAHAVAAHNTDGIFNRFVTVFANRARHVSGELSLGRETEAI
jgi:hypothetical protein